MKREQTSVSCCEKNLEKAEARVAELAGALRRIVDDARDEERADMRDSVDEQFIEEARAILEGVTPRRLRTDSVSLGAMPDGPEKERAANALDALTAEAEKNGEYPRPSEALPERKCVLCPKPTRTAISSFCSEECFNAYQHVEPRTKEAVPDLEHLGPFAREAWDPVGGRPVNPDPTAQWTDEEARRYGEIPAHLCDPRTNEAKATVVEIAPGGRRWFQVLDANGEEVARCVAWESAAFLAESLNDWDLTKARTDSALPTFAKTPPTRSSRIDASAFLAEYPTPTQTELAAFLDLALQRTEPPKVEDAPRLAYEAFTRAIGYEITHYRNWSLVTQREKDAWAMVVGMARPETALGDTVPKAAHLRMVAMCNEKAAAVKRLEARWLELHTWLDAHESEEAYEVRQALVSFLDGDCEHLWECEGVCDLCGAPMATGSEER